jgi:hypothetical protein
MGGRIIDGAGNPWFKADIAIKGERIIKIGKVDPSKAKRTLDATRRMVSPGFIDVHSHSDFSLIFDPRAERRPSGPHGGALRIEGSYAEVRTELRSEKTTIPLDYRLLLKEGRWHAYDIIADGVSLVKNYRSQFQKIIRDSSYQELVKKLRERRRKGMLSNEINVTYDIEGNDVIVNCDCGRLRRPLLVVENGKLLLNQKNLAELKEGRKNGVI